MSSRAMPLVGRTVALGHGRSPSNRHDHGRVTASERPRTYCVSDRSARPSSSPPLMLRGPLACDLIVSLNESLIKSHVVHLSENPGHVAHYGNSTGGTLVPQYAP